SVPRVTRCPDFIGTVITLSLLVYPVLKSLGLQLHSAVTGSYLSGTHSIAFINCLSPNSQGSSWLKQPQLNSFETMQITKPGSSA
uniref:Uncharacterized protein n=1 Tax=Chelydra serpentina TaxID=8475 RepID=A0A8C3XX10_CHESE